MNDAQCVSLLQWALPSLDRRWPAWKCVLSPRSLEGVHRVPPRGYSPQATGREFDLVLCRNVAFTYFSEPVQRDVLAHISKRLRTGGFLVIGSHETLPSDAGFLPLPAAPAIYRKST
ncbi:MAG: hypothetical protein EHM55_04410 [Acidobacteria bacterium]|nr:MAG: hypothetical protein EHM55_04410 [Acidobacteriota bacterium]